MVNLFWFTVCTAVSLVLGFFIGKYKHEKSINDNIKQYFHTLFAIINCIKFGTIDDKVKTAICSHNAFDIEECRYLVDFPTVHIICVRYRPTGSKQYFIYVHEME